MQYTMDMPPGVALLYRQMMEQLQEDQLQLSLAAIETRIHVSREALVALKEWTIKNPFANDNEEVHFFKSVKPLFYAQLLFYIKRYHFIISIPPSTIKAQEKFIGKQLQKLNHYFENHREFYMYWRSGSTVFDQSFFLRAGVLKKPPSIHNYYFETDPEFSTTHDAQVARILANELFADYLNGYFIKAPSSPSMQKLAWSASKVALAELVYAFYACGVFAQADIKKIADHFASVYDVQLGNIYKIFEEIRLRKKNRTAFIDSLRQNLLRKMDEDDERAF